MPHPLRHIALSPETLASRPLHRAAMDRQAERKTERETENRPAARTMDKLTWIKDLVRAEQKMEESGVVDFSFGFDPQQILFSESIAFLNGLKTSFVEASSSFNQLKGSTVGRIKIYGISNTHADFMLFRNGFKLIFALKEPGVIGIRFHFVGSGFTQVQVQAASDNGQKVTNEEDVLIARWGAFGDLVWTYQEQPVKVDYLVRYYLTRFIRESAK